MRILKKVALAVSSCALALSPALASGAWAITKADVEGDIHDDDEVAEFDIDLTNGKTFSFDGLGAECVKAIFETEGLTTAYVAFNESIDDFALAASPEDAFFELDVDGDAVTAKSLVDIDEDYPVQVLSDAYFFGCPIAIEQDGTKRIATEILEGVPDDDPSLIGPDGNPLYRYIELWVFATIRYGNEDNPDTFDATNYFLIMLSACAVPFGLMCFSLRKHRRKR